MSITAQFNQYLGQSVQDPDRLTCDCDPVADKISQEATSKGLMVNFVKAGQRPGANAPVDRLIVNIESGPTGWNIKSFEVLTA